MTLYVYDTEGYVGPLASGKGYDDLMEALMKAAPATKKFFDAGHMNRKELLDAIRDVSLPGEAGDTLDNLRQLALACDEIVIVTDGVFDESEEVHGGRGSGNFGHEGRPGERGGSAQGEGTRRGDYRVQRIPASEANSEELMAAVDKWPESRGKKEAADVAYFAGSVGTHVIVSRDDKERIVGLAGITESEDTVHIEDMGVRNKGKGIGRGLMEETCALAAEGDKSVTCEPRDSFAAHFFKHIGMASDHGGGFIFTPDEAKSFSKGERIKPKRNVLVAETHGGRGSGNFGHEGRPGERGGSAAGFGPDYARTRTRAPKMSPGGQALDDLSAAYGDKAKHEARIRSIIDPASKARVLSIRKDAIKHLAERQGKEPDAEDYARMEEEIKKNSKYEQPGYHLEDATPEELADIDKGLEPVVDNNVKLSGVSFMTPEEVASFPNGKGPAALYSVVSNEIRINREQMRSCGEDERLSDEGLKKQIQDGIKQGEELKHTSGHNMLTDMLIDDEINKMKTCTRWNPHSDKDPGASLVMHEAFHAVQANEPDGILNWFDALKDTEAPRDDAWSVSGYAATSKDPQEWWAEACVAKAYGLPLGDRWDVALKETGVKIPRVKE